MKHSNTSSLKISGVVGVDIVLYLDGGRYTLIEYNLRSRKIDEGAKYLLKIKRLNVENKFTGKWLEIRTPYQPIILTGGEITFTRENVIKVIPIGCLKH